MKLIWAQMSEVVIWYEHKCPGWSFDVSTNVWGGHLMWARMSGVVIWCEHECPALSKIPWEWMFVGTNVQNSFCSNVTWNGFFWNQCLIWKTFTMSFFPKQIHQKHNTLFKRSRRKANQNYIQFVSFETVFILTLGLSNPQMCQREVTL